jgi:hypothetical protein
MQNTSAPTELIGGCGEEKKSVFSVNRVDTQCDIPALKARVTYGETIAMISEFAFCSRIDPEAGDALSLVKLAGPFVNLAGLSGQGSWMCFIPMRALKMMG